MFNVLLPYVNPFAFRILRNREPPFTGGTLFGQDFVVAVETIAFLGAGHISGYVILLPGGQKDE